MAKQNLSESEKLVENLNTIANKIHEIKIELEEYNSGISETIISSNDRVEKLGEQSNFQHDLSLGISELYIQSAKDNFFWQYCPFSVYESTFENRKSDFLQKFPDARIKDFIENEDQNIKANNEDEIINFIGEVGYPEEHHTGNINYIFNFSPFIYDENTLLWNIVIDFGDREIKTKLNYTQSRKLEFIASMQRKNELVAEEKGLITEPKIFIDYSNNSKAERIVFMHELGILDYLQKKMNDELHGFSTNKLAEIVSTFTDIDSKYLQSMLNPIYSKGVNQKNNPLTEKILEKVSKRLMKIGFNNTKTT